MVATIAVSGSMDGDGHIEGTFCSRVFMLVGVLMTG